MWPICITAVGNSIIRIIKIIKMDFDENRAGCGAIISLAFSLFLFYSHFVLCFHPEWVWYAHALASKNTTNTFYRSIPVYLFSPKHINDMNMVRCTWPKLVCICFASHSARTRATMRSTKQYIVGEQYVYLESDEWHNNHIPLPSCEAICRPLMMTGECRWVAAKC